MRGADLSPRSVARIAGYSYVAIFVLAIFANFFVVSSLIESGDAAATAANIAGSEGLFRSGLVAFTIVFALDVLIAWALYVYFRPVDRDLSLLAAWFRVVYTVLLGVGLIFFFLVLQFVDGTGPVAALDLDQREVQIMLFLDAFEYAWLIGLVCFGVHLLLLATLVSRSRAIPRVIGFFLMAAGAVYVGDTIAHALLSNYEEYEDIFLALVAIPSVVGELSFALWLLVKGAKEPPALSEVAPAPAGEVLRQVASGRALSSAPEGEEVR